MYVLLASDDGFHCNGNCETNFYVLNKDNIMVLAQYIHQIFIW